MRAAVAALLARLALLTQVPIGWDTTLLKSPQQVDLRAHALTLPGPLRGPFLMVRM
jgi:hypothetical protein